jgi:trehalose/maltose hydrolase-like predicted phosphorylase
VHEPVGDGLATLRFASLTRPGLVVVHAEGPPGTVWSHELLRPPHLGRSEPLAAGFTYRAGRRDGRAWAETISDRATVTAVAGQTVRDTSADRFMAVDANDAVVDAAAEAGFDRLQAEQRAAWAARWAAADIEIEGDPASQQAIRFALFHLLSCAPLSGEAPVGARGLTGLAYSGHVFWDADVFVLPVLAATLPAAALSMLEYRLRRVGAAQAIAAAHGQAGARFPWESADAGEDVTPVSVRDQHGHIVPIRTGTHEVHIDAAVAWAADHYLDWSGDDAFREGHATLLLETARWWASRIVVDRDGSAHLRGVMGPDEYHDVVDDDAYTNVMARWNLRRAAALLDPNDPEARWWEQLAASLADGYDPATGRHEQFAGFAALEPLRIVDVSTVPVAADVLLGAARVAGAQVLKQPDVLMLHHLVPHELPAGSLVADLEYYLPRTAHGSSLSPAVCASLLARAGRADEALALFDLAARLDLDDVTDTTAAGLHLATLGGLWQALVRGFAGVRLDGGVLRVDPCLPERWSRITVRLQWRGIPLQLSIGPEEVALTASGPLQAVVHGVPIDAPGRVVRDGSEWRRR